MASLGLSLGKDQGDNMRIIKTNEVPEEDITSSPIFFGGAVSRQELVDSKTSELFNFNLINFNAGAKNKLHTHSSDQILYVVSGKGIVATEKSEHIVTEGVTVHIPAGERHWHGATDDSPFSHIALTAVGSNTKIVG